MITQQDIFNFSKKANPAIVAGFVDTVNANAEKFGLTTPGRMAKFLANVMVETDGLKTFQEYASGAAYEGRKDLGNIYKGDGKKFKGRGALQTTGRYNYGQLSEIVYGDKNVLLNNPTILLDPVRGTEAALIYWHKKNLNYHADNSPFSKVVRIINGGLNHLSQRTNWLNKIYEVLKKKTVIQAPATPSIAGIVLILGLVLYLAYKIKK
ncbi:MAG: hypothetical protein R2831_10855 [Chitinophagaceae bacterium]